MGNWQWRYLEEQLAELKGRTGEIQQLLAETSRI